MYSVCDDGIYEFECPQGHHTTTVLRTPKHEVLYTIGANAFLDGYFRDAIASFASALERYYEFALRIISRHKKITLEMFMETWGFMPNQSERQYGAFITVWMIERKGEPYTKFSKTQIDKSNTLRNGVIHKGNIPTPAQCLEYGQYVMDIIAPIEKVLLADYAAAHKDECFALFRDESTKRATPITALSIFSVLDSALKNDDKKLEPIIARLEEVRTYKGNFSVGVKHQMVTHHRK
ncbi:MAG: hypothetical protein ABL913_05560 [Methyloglobulus sp.]|nr:hypothetical protein [Methyloglobulus sp.]